MAFPGILRRLFQNNGAGPLLRPEIVPFGLPKGLVAPFYRVAFGGSDGRRPIFWGQTVADEGWVLADGGSDGAGGKVPDLRDRMIMGAGGSCAAGATGGAITHSHSVSGNVGGTTLSESQMPSHTHGLRRVNEGIHGLGTGNFVGGHNVDYYTDSAGASYSHDHSLSAASTSAAGSLPPFYALAIFVKI